MSRTWVFGAEFFDVGATTGDAYRKYLGQQDFGYGSDLDPTGAAYAGESYGFNGDPNAVSGSAADYTPGAAPPTDPGVPTNTGALTGPSRRDPRAPLQQSTTASNPGQGYQTSTEGAPSAYAGTGLANAPGGGAAPLPSGYTYGQDGSVIGPDGQPLNTNSQLQPNTTGLPPGRAPVTPPGGPTTDPNSTPAGTATNPRAPVIPPGRTNTNPNSPNYQWGSAGASGNRTAAGGQAFKTYTGMVENPGYSEGTKSAIMQSAIDASNAKYAGASDEISRRAAAGGNDAGTGSELAYLGRQQANTAADTVRSSRIGFEQEAQRQKEAGAAGLANEGAQEGQYNLAALAGRAGVASTLRTSGQGGASSQTTAGTNFGIGS